MPKRNPWAENKDVIIDEAIAKLQAARKKSKLRGNTLLVLCLVDSELPDVSVDDVVLVESEDGAVVEVQVKHADVNRLTAHPKVLVVLGNGGVQSVHATIPVDVVIQDYDVPRDSGFADESDEKRQTVVFTPKGGNEVGIMTPEALEDFIQGDPDDDDDKPLTREQLLDEVNSYAERLVTAGDMNAFKEVFGSSDRNFDIKTLTDEELKVIFDEYIDLVDKDGNRI